MSASSQAGASVLTLVGGVLGISIGALPPIQFPQNVSGVPISVSSGAGSFTEPANLFTGSVMLPTSLFTGVALINGLTIGNFANGTKVINTAGAIAGPRTMHVLRAGSGTLGGPGALTGTAFINVLGLFNLAIPLGVVGNTGGSTAVVAGTLAVSVNGTGWTTGTVTITGVTTGSPVVNTVIYGGYDNRASHIGVIQLISPFKVITNAAGNLPGLATQTLTFIGVHVPEPGTLLLLGSGVVGLALYGRRKMRK
jgi:hypothetical protein